MEVKILCFAQHIILIYLIIDVNFDILINVISVSLLYYKVTLSIIFNRLI